MPAHADDPFTRDELVAVALRIVDEQGLSALTIRALAAELGVFPATVQWHVGNKQALLAAVSGLVVAEVDLPGPDLEWSLAVAELCRSWRTTLHRHPNVAAIVSGQLAVTPAVLPLVDAVLEALTTAGFSSLDLVDAYNAVIGFLLGWVPAELSTPTAGEWAADHSRTLEELDFSALPMLAGHLDLLRGNAFMTRFVTGREQPLDRSFDFAVQTLIAGLEAQLRR